MILPFNDPCDGPGIDPNWNGIGFGSFRQDAGLYKGDNQSDNEAAPTQATGSQQLSLIGEVCGSMEADVGIVSTSPLDQFAYVPYTGSILNTYIIACPAQFWSQNFTVALIANLSADTTAVDIRLVAVANGVITYSQILASGLNINQAWNIRVTRVGITYEIYVDDVLVYTEVGAIASDSTDPAVCLGYAEGATLAGAKLFGTLDNIEVLPFGSPPPELDAPNLLLPPDGSVQIYTRPTLNWEAVPGALTYNLQIATDIGFSGIVHSASGLTETIYEVPVALEQGVVHYWRVQAED